jgi:hypothetical protein
MEAPWLQLGGFDVSIVALVLETDGASAIFSELKGLRS